MIFFFFQAEDGIRDYKVTGVQTCALPICAPRGSAPAGRCSRRRCGSKRASTGSSGAAGGAARAGGRLVAFRPRDRSEIGRAACRGRGEISGVAVSLKKKKKETTKEHVVEY